LGDDGIDGMAILAQGIKELRRRCSAKDNSEPVVRISFQDDHRGAATPRLIRSGVTPSTKARE